MTTLPQPTTETLYDLWGRLKERSRGDETNDDVTLQYGPSSRAREFVSSQSGISFIDAALSLCNDSITAASVTTATKNAGLISKPIVIDISGDTSTGKSTTIVTLAARYLFSTRNLPHNKKDVIIDFSDAKMQRSKDLVDQIGNESMLFPQVILFDVNRDVTNCTRRVYDLLLSMIQEEFYASNGNKENHLQTTVNDEVDTFLENEVIECLKRLHIARVDDFPQWGLLLETLRHELSYLQQQQQPSVLLLWDDFLDEVIVTTTLVPHGLSTSSYHNHESYHRSTRAETTAIRMDVIRQFERLLQVCPKNTLAVTTSSTNSYYGGTPKVPQKRIIGKEWNRFVSVSIHLQRCWNHSVVTTSCNGNEVMATNGGSSILDISDSSTTYKASQYNPSLGLAIVTANSAINTHVVQQQQLHLQIPFSIASNGMVS